MKTVDFKDGKFEVRDFLDQTEICKAEAAGEITEDEADKLWKESEEEIDCTEKTVKDLPYPNGLHTCIGVNGTFHIKSDIGGWRSLDKQQAAKLAYSLAKFVES